MADYNLEVGHVVEGKVTGITDFGAFIKIKNSGKTGLVHISEIADVYVKKASDYFSIGDFVKSKVIKIDEEGKIGLSTKQFLQKKSNKKKSKGKKKTKIKNNGNYYSYLPADTNKILTKKDKIDNLALKINKYIEKADRVIKGNDKGKFLEKISIKDDRLLELLLQRNQNILQTFDDSGYQINFFEMINDYRVVVGLGGANVLETNLLLHHTYGIPYIPGSALKGLAKAWAVEKLREIFSEEDYDRIKGDSDKNQYEIIGGLLENDELGEEVLTKEQLKEVIIYRKIFGTQEQAGQTIFFDAFPVEKINLNVDIMTPHFGEYYKEMEQKEPEIYPTDYQDPTPIQFLVLEEQKFNFRLAFKCEDCIDNKDECESLEIVTNLLKEGLKNLGIGAKTMLGYGYFE